MSSPTTTHHTAIQQVMADYVTGANGDLDLLQSVFHPNALINGRPIAALYRIVQRRGNTNATHRTELIDVHGNVANVKIIVEDWHDLAFVEFFHLINTDEGWKITSKSGDDLNETN